MCSSDLAGALFAFVLSFIPPDQIAVGSKTVWYIVLFAGCVIFVGIPFVIFACKKPSWTINDGVGFEPFYWEIESDKHKD